MKFSKILSFALMCLSLGSCGQFTSNGNIIIDADLYGEDIRVQLPFAINNIGDINKLIANTPSSQAVWNIPAKTLNFAIVMTKVYEYQLNDDMIEEFKTKFKENCLNCEEEGFTVNHFMYMNLFDLNYNFTLQSEREQE